MTSSTAEKKPLDLKDLGKWEFLAGPTAVSNDGRWLAYGVRRNNRESEIRLFDLVGNKEQIFKEGGSYRFSEDNRWLGYIVSPDAKTQDKLRKEKKPIRRKLALMNLSTMTTTYVDDVASFEFSGDGQFVSIKKAAAQGSESKPSNVVVRDLANGRDLAFGNVREYDWSTNGSLLAIVTEMPDSLGNSVTLFDGKTRSVRFLDTEKATYAGIAWRRDSEDLAVLRSFENEEFEGKSHSILVWRGTSAPGATTMTFAPASRTDFPKGSKIPEKTSLQWSRSGNELFFGIEVWKKRPKKEEKPENGEKPDPEQPVDEDEIPALEIWNYSDVLTISEQKASNESGAKLSVWHLGSDKFVTLEDERTRIRFQNDSPVLIGADDVPYEFEGMFGRPSADLYSVDIATGSRKKILADVPVAFSNAVSPTGRYFVYLKDDDYRLFDLSSSRDINLTKGLGDSFVDLEDDHPVAQKPPFGFLGWDRTGSYFLVNSKHDVWRFDAASGKGTKLTDGKAANAEIRLERVRSRDGYVDLAEPHFVRRFSKTDKTSGYTYRDGKKEIAVHNGDNLAGNLVKARDSDRVILRIESYNESPDYYTWQPGDPGPTRVSKINPFEDQYKSGKAEIVQYTNANGLTLQGSLYYPDDYVPGKKYPMITYIYELLSDGFHRHSVPSTTNYYNRRVFTSQGYFVFMPDIVFDPGDPGVSSVKTLEIAVKAVVDKGLIDEKRVGLVGHSWGGYQAAFAVTRTNIFAAAVAGAGISNLITMYGTVTPSFGGQFESKHLEVSQERMMVPPWKDIDGYLRNSAIPNIEKMQTPLLMEVGDADTNVNWGQGLEMYNAARREKKPMVLLVYAKEGHGLSAAKNQADYQRRILEWFGHYLKKEPGKRWITENITYKEQQDLLKEGELE